MRIPCSDIELDNWELMIAGAVVVLVVLFAWSNPDIPSPAPSFGSQGQWIDIPPGGWAFIRVINSSRTIWIAWTVDVGGART